MGLLFSAFNNFGQPGLSALTSGQIYDRHFRDKETDNFENFHIAYVEFCKYFNIVLPGQDFYTPQLSEIKRFYEEWSQKDDHDKKQAFINYMESHVTEAKYDDSFFIMAGLAVPAASIYAKRVGESIPQMKKFKLDCIPNVVFVPVCTLLAIMGVTAIQMNKKRKSNPA